MGNEQKSSIRCNHCGGEITFDQPYPFHAGFSDEGFLYNDSGNCTLIWSITDPVLAELFPGNSFWMRSWLYRRKLEKILPAAPVGGRWRFRNPARCTRCKKPIAPPMLKSIHYLLYPGSIRTNIDLSMGLKDLIAPNREKNQITTVNSQGIL
jgi:hypothetical protein